jgi:DNA invertase Pin-like site-specific DNA recombinase
VGDLTGSCSRPYDKKTDSNNVFNAHALVSMIERTRAGLAAAAASGRKGGRPRKVDDADAAKARSLRDKGITAIDIAKMLGVSRPTVYRYLSDGVPLSA